MRAILLSATVLVVVASCTPNPHPDLAAPFEEPGAEMTCPFMEGWTSVPVRHEVPGVPDGALTGAGTILGNGPQGALWEYTAADPARQRLISEKRYRRFRLSPDAKVLAGVVDDELWLLHIETGTEEPLSIPASGVLAWRPDGHSFLFVGSAEGADGIGEIHLADLRIHWWAWASPDLSVPDPREGAVQIVDGFFDMPHTAGSISSDGTRLVLSAGHSGTMSIFVLDLLDGNLHVYPKTGGDGFHPQWYADLPYVIFGYGNLRLLDTVTGEVRQIGSGFPMQGTIADMRERTILAVVTSGESSCWMLGDLPPLAIKP